MNKDRQTRVRDRQPASTPQPDTAKSLQQVKFKSFLPDVALSVDIDNVQYVTHNNVLVAARRKTSRDVETKTTLVTEEELQEKELKAKRLVDAWRKEKHSIEKSLIRITVLDKAANIQARYLTENKLPLTHTTDDSWLRSKYPAAVAATKVVPTHRTRSRMKVGSYETTQKTTPDYSGNGGVELLVAGTDNPQTVLDALAASPNHAPALKNPDYKDVGIRAMQTEDGVTYWAIVLGRGDNKNNWEISTRGFKNFIYLPTVMKS